jgi:CRP/FNR family cyclic AMP-dependent transcriptional regulator
LTINLEKNVSDFHAAREIVVHRGWLSQTPQMFQRAVLDKCYLQEFKEGTTIYTAGDPPGGMFGLVTGDLGVSIAPGERGPYLAHVFRPGAWFGETPAFSGQSRRIGVVATRDTELLHLPLQGIHEIVSRDPEAWRFFALIAIGHLDMIIGGCVDLMIRDHVRRFIAVLLRLGGCRLATRPGSVPIEVDVNQEDLAAMANMIRTTAGTILRKLEGAGHIELSYRRIRILAPDSLRAMLVESAHDSDASGHACQLSEVRFTRKLDRDRLTQPLRVARTRR